MERKKNQLFYESFHVTQDPELSRKNFIGFVF